MAKSRKTRRFITLESKITAAQDKVVRAKNRCKKAVRMLEVLMEKREESDAGN